MPDLNVYYYMAHPGAVLRAKGPDAFTFLQSQFANDLKHEEVDNPVTYGLWLDHKGKIVADSFVIQKAKDDFLILSYDIPAAVLKGHLDAHLIADEVELTDETAALGLLHVWADAYEETLAQLIEETAQAAGAECWMGRRPRVFSAWDILGTPEVLSKIIGQLSEHGIEPGDAELLYATRVLAGIPAVPQDVGPGDLPQEAALEHDAVAFDKGCYIGQEIMQRLNTQGHPTRALWQVKWEVKTTRPTDNAPIPLYADDVQAGELRSRIFKDIGGMGLAMLKTRLTAGRPALSLSPNGPKVILPVRNLTER